MAMIFPNCMHAFNTTVRAIKKMCFWFTEMNNSSFNKNILSRLETFVSDATCDFTTIKLHTNTTTVKIANLDSLNSVSKVYSSPNSIMFKNKILPSRNQTTLVEQF